MGQISLLLGAGFSANQGYPTASRLNTLLTEVSDRAYTVASEGTVIALKPGEQDPHNYSGHRTYLQFSIKLIEFYMRRHSFDYEEFYDFYQALLKGKDDPEFKVMCDQFRKEYYTEIDDHNLLYHHNHVFNQLITLMLVDRDGKQFYPPSHACKPIIPGYTGFLNCLEQWGADHVVHIHSLNHDLFFETFNHSDWLKGELSDGFQELGSPFYGDFADRFKIRLPHFTDKYETRYRYYKLHGSTDQFPFHLEGSGIDTYIKIKPGILHTGLYKEVTDAEGKQEYVNDFINYHSDFLSGTTSKILRYREPWYYEKIFRHFENNLRDSEMLAIIGYGCRDSEINRLIIQHYGKTRPVYLVEPYPGPHTFEFLKQVNGKLIEKFPDQLLIQFFS